MKRIVWTNGDYRVVADDSEKPTRYYYEALFRDQMGEPSWRTLDPPGIAFLEMVVRSLDTSERKP